jgi:hypothetical protein
VTDLTAVWLSLSTRSCMLVTTVLSPSKTGPRPAAGKGDGEPHRLGFFECSGRVVASVAGAPIHAHAALPVSHAAGGLVTASANSATRFRGSAGRIASVASKFGRSAQYPEGCWGYR